MKIDVYYCINNILPQFSAQSQIHPIQLTNTFFLTSTLILCSHLRLGLQNEHKPTANITFCNNLNLNQ